MRSHHVIAVACATLLVAACGTRASLRTATTPVTETAALDQSLFAKDPRGVLSEDTIQAILRRPLEIELPARVGVLPITPARDWQGPGPSDEAPPASARFAAELRGGEPFTMVTEMISIPSGSLGMEALRALAARYKLRYVVLYRENITKKRKTNAWSIGYLTIVGALFLPGDTLEVDGYVEASMFDVKTGLLMFTVRKRVRSKDKHNPWYTDDKLEQLENRLAVQAAGELAAELRSGIHAFEAAVAAEQTPAPSDTTDPAGPAPAAAPTAAIEPAHETPAPADNVP